MNCRHFLGIDFCIDFWMHFDGKLSILAPKMASANYPVAPLLAPFWRPFSDIDFWMHFGRPLAPFGHPLGSIWLPFGTLWASFWFPGAPWDSILIPVGTLWAPFWSLWAPFWLHFRSLGAILVKNHVFGHPISRITRRLPSAPPRRADFRLHHDLSWTRSGNLPLAT